MRLLLRADGVKSRVSARLFSAYLPSLLVLLLLATIALLQWAAVGGGFHFDDEPNLRDLGAYGGVTSWEALRAYLSSGFAGPTGRPLALLSFLIDDNTWPTAPEGFKRTNLFLHLINVALLIWLTLQLLRFYGLSEVRATWGALIAAALWGLHPFLISTTFYVVQRMAMLAATFSLLGILLYLRGRLLWPERPRAALLWMAGGVFGGTLCAVLSKENGALLPLLILTIEWFAPPGRAPLPCLFRWGVLYLPSVALVAYLATYFNFSPNPWPERPFNQIERLLTEARILWDYLGNWFIPRIEGAGLLRDGIAISRSLVDPPQTAVAVVALVLLVAAVVGLRRRAPLLALGFAFFLVGHLMESGWLGLELYFEHRNYLPTIFLLLPLAVWAVDERATAIRFVARLLTLGLLLLLSAFSYQRAQLWRDPVQLEAYWALAAQGSPRAANALARRLTEVGRFSEAEQVLREAVERNPQSGLLLLTLLQLRINLNEATRDDFVEVARRLHTVPFDAQTVTALRHLTERAIRPSASPLEREGIRLVIEHLATNEQYRQFPLFRRLIPYLLAQLDLADGKITEAERHYAEAMRLYGQVDAGMQMVAEVGNANYPDAALRLLDQVEQLLAESSDRMLKFPRAFYEREIARIRALLLEERERDSSDR